MLTLPKLEYSHDSLEPYIDKLNLALQNNPQLQNKNAEELIKGLNNLPDNIREAVKNQGGGHVNHIFFGQY